MSETTNLKLFKHDNPATNENQFDVTKALNNNWDKIDDFAETTNTKITENQNNIKSLQTDNTTNKQDIATLKSDNTTNKANIKALQDDNKTNKDNIEALQQENEELKAENERLNQDLNALPSNTAEGEYITLTDSADSRFNKFKIKGNSIQNGEPTPENLIEIQNVKGKTTIKITNENLANINEIYNNMKAFDSNSCSETVVDGIECIEFNNTSYQPIKNFNLIDYNYKVNTAYTIRGKFKKKNESDTVRLYIQVIYTDGTQDLVISADNGWFELRIVTNSSKTIKNIGFSYSNGGYYYLDKSSIFIGEGNANDYILNQQKKIIFPLSEGQVLREGDYLADDGIHHVKGQKIVDGTENNWVYYSANDEWARPYFQITNKKLNESDNTNNVLCNKMAQGTWNNSRFGTINKNVVFSYSADKRISFLIKKSDLETQNVAGVQKYFQKNNMLIEYNLEEEVVEPYNEEQQKAYDEIVNTAKTYKTVTNIFSSNEVSPVFEVNYRKDIETMINSVNKAVLSNA